MKYNKRQSEQSEKRLSKFTFGAQYYIIALKDSSAFANTLCFPLLFLILQLTTLYSGHIASVQCSSDVILFNILSGKWNVELKIPGFTSSVIFALISTLPLGLSTPTISPSFIN